MTIELAPASSKMMTYDEALLYCTFCNHDGYTDWRLPTKSEYFRWGHRAGYWFQNRRNPNVSTKLFVRLVRDV